MRKSPASDKPGVTSSQPDDPPIAAARDRGIMSPAAPRDQRYKWAYIFGAVCPARDHGAALILPKANAKAMNLYVLEIRSQVSAGAHAVVILDRAGWHKTGDKLWVPGNISPLHLPAYPPELNPTENIWQYLRQNPLSNRLHANYKAIVDACCDA